MKKSIQPICGGFILLTQLIFSFQLSAQVSGVKTIPGHYISINAAISDISSQGLGGATILELQASYDAAVETFPIIIPALPGSSAANSLTISPAAGANGIIINSNNSGPAIDLVKATYIFIDGRPGRTGTTRDMIIRNYSNDGTALRFLNGASNNLLNWCIFQSGDFVFNNGVITFDYSGGPPAGNNSNTISNCKIEGAIANIDPPWLGIYANGHSDAPNSDNSIINNEIANIGLYGIRVEEHTNGGGWNISGNSIYSQIEVPGQSGRTGIDFRPGSAADNNIISGNYIGGQAPLASGSKWTNTGDDGRATFIGILIKAGIGNGTAVSGNVIQNLAPTASNPRITGIVIEQGAVQVTGNLIGGTMEANNCIISGGNSVMEGIINYSCSPVSIVNNTIRNIEMTGYMLRFLGIGRVTGSNITISGNQIFLVNANSTGPVDFVAIGIAPDNFNMCSNVINPAVLDLNLLHTITLASSGDDASFTGIMITERISANDGNVIGSATQGNSIVVSGNHVTVNGILINGTEDLTISKDIIANITALGSVSSSINGISYTGTGTANFIQNDIHHLNAAISKGILINLPTGSSTVLLDSNKVVGTNTTGGTGIETQVAGAAVLQLTVTDNTVNNWLKGIQLATGTNASLQNNNITSNGTGVENQSSVPVNATCNWWGNASGPSGQGPGSGDPVGPNVIFSPWATIPTFVSVNAGPDQTIYTGYGSTTATLTATAVVCGIPSFEWSTGATTQSIVVSPAVTTSYTVVLTDANNHTAMDNVTVFVEDIRCGSKNEKLTICHKGKSTHCISVNTLNEHLAHGDKLGACTNSPGIAFRETAEEEIFELRVFPNPAFSQLKLQWDAEKAGTATVQITDMPGRIVFTQNIPESPGKNNRLLAVSHLKNGQYILQLFSGGRFLKEKIIIQK